MIVKTLFSNYQETASEKTIAKKWSHNIIEYPKGFDSHKLKYTYTQDENILTFHVSGIQKDGETKVFDIKINTENGKYEINK